MNLIKIITPLTLLALCINVHAGWLCVVHNTRDEIWNGTGPTRALALGNAMEFCTNNSDKASNCVVNQCSEG